MQTLPKPLPNQQRAWRKSAKPTTFNPPDPLSKRSQQASPETEKVSTATNKSKAQAPRFKRQTGWSDSTPCPEEVAMPLEGSGGRDSRLLKFRLFLLGNLARTNYIPKRELVSWTPANGATLPTLREDPDFRGETQSQGQRASSVP